MALLLMLISCSADDAGYAADNTVHLAGFVDNGTDGGLASYWKDGVVTHLTEEHIASKATSLYIENRTVVIGGLRRDEFPRAIIWKDGIGTIIGDSYGGRTLALSRNGNLYAVWRHADGGWLLLKEGVTQPLLDTAYNLEATGVTLAGDNLYIGGNALEPNSEGKQHAQIWQNGQLIFREPRVSYAASIFVHDDNIYLGGFLYSNTEPNIACYWKNQKRIDLTDGSVNAIVRSVFVTDDHVYAAGMINDQAVYWKDDVVTLLTSGDNYSMANAIFIKGEDVHVAGYEHGHPAYWRNDVKQPLENEDQRGQIYFLAVGSN